MRDHYYTIEAFYRKKWSDKYSLKYYDLLEAKQQAQKHFDSEVEEGHIFNDVIGNHYRIKENIIETNTILL